jgi:hypothetical protein
MFYTDCCIVKAFGDTVFQASCLLDKIVLTCASSEAATATQLICEFTDFTLFHVTSYRSRNSSYPVTVLEVGSRTRGMDGERF